MALIRQDKVDQGARIGRLESYVYSFHGSPPPPTNGGGGTTPPGTGVPPSITPPNRPLPVPGQTPIVAGGSVPFTGYQFFYNGLDVSGRNPGIRFSEPDQIQVITGAGGTKGGEWIVGKIDPLSTVLSIHNNMKGDIGGRLDLHGNGEVEIKDFVKINDRRPGGGKDTLSLNSTGICNVGIDFCNDDHPVWEVYKTGKNHFEIGFAGTKAGHKYKKALEIDTDRQVHFSEIPTSFGTPKADKDLVTVKFMNDTLNGSGGAGSTPIVDLGKPAKIKDHLEIYGNGDGAINFTTNFKQTVGGKTKTGSWIMGKTRTQFDKVKIENISNGHVASLELGDNGIITTTDKFVIGNTRTGKAQLTLESAMLTDKLEILLRDSGGDKASFGVKGGQLEITGTKGDVHINLEANRHIVAKRGSQTNNVLTTESGPTGARPTHGLFVGDQFFDTTLKHPIWVSDINPTVWINALGKKV